MVQYCKLCVMPDTRPGIKFVDGVCQGCITHANKLKTNWAQRMEELEKLCAQYRGKGMFDCIIAVSSGKDSHYQVHVMKELMHMNPLLVTVEDNFPSTKAGEHNIKNISEAFSCPINALKPNIAVQKKVMRYTFEQFGMPTWYIDNLIYRYPPYIAAQLNIPLIVYGENVSYEYGGSDAVENPSAMNQIANGVAPDTIGRELIRKGYATPTDLFYIGILQEQIKPVYLSYYVPWNAHEHYLFAKSRGFWDLDVADHWDRVGVADNYSQIDSRAYLVHPWMKWAKYGHSWGMTDLLSRQIRYGLITRAEAICQLKFGEGLLDPRCVEDFCGFLGYSIEEFWAIVEKFYNRELFYAKDRLKHPIWEASP